MELWFSELHTPGVKLSIKVDRQLFSAVSEFQRIDIFESKDFGRFLILDGCMMLTEKDEFIYHEMITHVPMCVNPSIKKILLIGGGDGGTARELLKYSTVDAIDLVEIDEIVVDACKKYLPQTAGCLDDPRVSIHIEDGLKFVRLIRSDRAKGSSRKSFTGIVSRRSARTGSWSISMKIRSTRRTRSPCNARTNALCHRFRSVGCINCTFRRIHRGIGCSDLRRRSITRSTAWISTVGSAWGSRRAIIM